MALPNFMHHYLYSHSLNKLIFKPVLFVNNKATDVFESPVGKSIMLALSQKFNSNLIYFFNQKNSIQV